MQKINPCLWFDHEAEEAAKFYTSVFKNSKIGNIQRYGASGAKISGQPEGAIMSVEFEIKGFKFVGLNGGPIFKMTPAMSYSAFCKDEKEIKDLWSNLSSGGIVRMEFGKYPWAEHYGWCDDKFGVSWQLMVYPEAKQPITPSLLFTKGVVGKAEEAIKYYTTIFKNSSIEAIHKDPNTNLVQHSQFYLGGEQIILMEDSGPHEFGFTEGNSLMVNCKDQSEVDYYWTELSKGGLVQPCGWVKDKYGVSWQIVPTVLNEMVNDQDKAKVEKMMAAMLKMEKLDIAKLEQAFRS
jgi:predicted 3-demethylubiquinone-9 3-methyltransferase (glyoxalase superfamily)